MAVIEPQEPDLFTPDSFKMLNSEGAANSALRIFSGLASRYQTALIRKGFTNAQVEKTMGVLWGRIITGCKRHGVPLNEAAEEWERRLSK